MPELEQHISGVTGFSVAGVSAGLKGGDTLDFALIVSDRPCEAAGVFTTNLVKAAPVLLNMQALAEHASEIRAIAVNTRCANACTGEHGMANGREMARLTGEALNIVPESVLVLSTGVIGTQLPMDKIARGISLASGALGSDWDAAAQAIMT
ncbi:MAG TPA: bifunctional ornithine acetyltransferase/N-acetylglutamate synthase, partial [Candidatus Limnocylindrales bacterium]|nr:bifunctional ornithine acetyltransferase/N-acetylglutamate synthase [Candidatus Limnocylindrales bacterium]